MELFYFILTFIISIKRIVNSIKTSKRKKSKSIIKSIFYYICIIQLFVVGANERSIFSVKSELLAPVFFFTNTGIGRAQ